VTHVTITDACESAGSAPALKRVSFPVKGGAMAGLEFGEPGHGPAIVFLHAAGFNARTYRRLLAPLGDRYHVVALDLRGHGRTTLPAHTFGYASWSRHAEDVIAVLERHYTKPVTLSGHSLGATVSLLAAGRRPDLAGSLALIEPVIFTPSGYAFDGVLGAPAWRRATMGLARMAGRRRASFPDQATAVATLKQRGIYRSFSPDELEDFIEDGLVDDGAGALNLVCTPAYEAATYAAQRHDPWRALLSAPRNIVVLRAEHGSTLSEASARRLQITRRDARLATVDGATHALPMERPDRARAAIVTAALMAAPNHVRNLDGL